MLNCPDPDSTEAEIKTKIIFNKISLIIIIFIQTINILYFSTFILIYFNHFISLSTNHTWSTAQFLSCKIENEETAINFLTRLEQRANEARNYDIRITEKIFLWVLLNNMKHHRFYRERISSFLTTFELNPNSITQRWLENKILFLGWWKDAHISSKIS